MKAWTAFKLGLISAMTVTMLWHWQVTEAVAAVRPEVIERFQQDGGTISEVAVTCLGSDYDGSYRHNTREIEMQTGAPEWVLPHEYGHYVYHSTVDQWDAEHQQKLTGLYSYYKDMDRRCYSENETFAVLYSVYCTEQTGGDLRELMEYAEQILLKGE